MAFENYVGRVGGLAVALGIGAAVATGWSRPAWADTTDGSVKPPASDTQNSSEPDTPPKSTPSEDNSGAGGTTGTPAAQTGAGADDATDDPQAEAAESEAPEAPEAGQPADPPVGAQLPEQHSSNKPGRTLVVDVTDTDEDKTKEPEADPVIDRTVADEPVVADGPTPTPTSGKPVAATFAVTADLLPAQNVAEPEEPTALIAAVGDITPADGQSTSDPLAPLQATAALTALAAISSDSERRSLIRSANLVAPQVTTSEEDSTPNVLLIGVDGTNLSRILANDNNTNFFSLMQTGTTAPASIVGHTTISNPSWTAILTGVWGETTGVINNIYNPAVYDAFPTVFNQLETFNPLINTTAIADWDVIAAIAASGAVHADSVQYVSQVAGDTDWSLTDDAVGAATVNAITNADYSAPNFMFSYFVGVDENGHMHGGASQQYADAITNVDENLAAIMEAIALSGEQWTIIVVTDHGHQASQGFGHGFQSPNETSTFVIANNPDLFTPGNINLQYSIVDTTPTVVTLFGGTPASYSNGVSLTTLGDADVTPINNDDGLRGALQDIIDKNGYPNIGTDLSLGARTIFASIPYFVVQFTDSATSALQAIADQDIFLISPLASLAIVPVQLLGDLLYIPTNILAQVVAWLTGVSNTSIFPLLPAPLPPLEGPPGLQDAAGVVCGVPGYGADRCMAV